MTKIIDCTLRDGGYLTNWHFDMSFVRKLYDTACLSGVDYLEAGYRNNKISDNFGEFALCDDDFLRSVFIDLKGCKLAVMADVTKSDISLFHDADKSLISLVRVATYPETLTEAFEFCEGIYQKGYDVMLNLMAFGKYCETDIKKISAWKNKKILKSVCFSDSYGAFYPSDIIKYYNSLKYIGFDNISLHTHNNLQLAFANSIKFIENGGYSVDASVGGVGRGGGILPIELILGYLNKNEKVNYTPLCYLRFIADNKEKFEHTDIKSIIGGLNNIHPNFVQDLFDNKLMDVEEIWYKTSQKL